MNEQESSNPENQQRTTLPNDAAPTADEPAVGPHERDAGVLRSITLDDAPRSMSPEYAETNISVAREGIRRYGEAFLAYVILDGVEQRSQSLVEEFEARYAGHFPDRDSFVAWALEDTGLSADLDDLMALQGMWRDDVRWCYEQMWDQMSQRYALTERLGGVHAFRR